MRIILFLLSALALLAGSGILATAQSAIHEIEAFILFLICAVCLVGASVVEAIIVARKKIESVIQKSFTESNRVVESSSSSSAPVPATTSSSKVGYYYSTDGQQWGPVDGSDLRMMRKDGLVTDDTPVLKDGDSEWRKFRDYLSLNR